MFVRSRLEARRNCNCRDRAKRTRNSRPGDHHRRRKFQTRRVPRFMFRDVYLERVVRVCEVGARRVAQCMFLCWF